MQTTFQERLSGPFDPTANVPKLTISDSNAGFDCIAQVQALQELRPNLKVMIGTVVVWCQDELARHRPWYFQKPWHWHCWLVDDAGVIHDPAIHNLGTWAAASQCTLPNHHQLWAKELPNASDADVSALVGWSFNDWPTFGEVIYLPGVIYECNRAPYSSVFTYERVETWASVAELAVQWQGFTPKEFTAALKIVDDWVQLRAPKGPTLLGKTIKRLVP